jgi:hypothetical protein
MHSDRLFRLLHHATLAIACICLLNAEQTFLPGVHWFMLPTFLIVFAAWRLEGRWRLPVWAANLLGLALLAGFALLVQQLLQVQGSWLQNAPMPAGMVPLLGPLLIGLLLVRLFRPRVAGDFWVLQSYGALQVGLACVLGIAPELGLLLPLYLACALGCLVEHYLVSGQARASAATSTSVSETGAAGAPRAGVRGGVRLGRFLLLWMPVVAGSAVLLFFGMPRPEVSEWVRPAGNFGGVRSESDKQSGYLNSIDPSSLGWVDLSNEVAFRVTADDDSGPFTHLPADQRWRFRVLDTYAEGKWSCSASFKAQSLWRNSPLTRIHPAQVHLTFTVKPHDAGGLFLADPILLGRTSDQASARMLEPWSLRPRSYFFEELGTLLPFAPAENQEYRYEQVFLPRQAGRGDTVDRATIQLLDPVYPPYLIGIQWPQLTDWTVTLLRRLAADRRYELQGVLRPAPVDGSSRGFVVDPENWERVARVLADYLATGGEYSYTLHLRRQDTGLDPMLDFLWNVKAGHCDRFAPALTVMLRSIGIPARIVKGYKGVEHEGNGHYVVRQNQAHSWVEALVPARGPVGLEWVTLDPTPGDDPATTEPFSLARLLEKSQRNSQFFWQELILGYNSSSRANLLEHLSLPSWSALGTIAGGMTVVASGAFLWRRKRKLQVRSPRSADRFYARLLALVQRHFDLSPQLGQTPRAFAQLAEARLRDRGAGALADVPAEVVDGLYRTRFGGVALSEEEAARIAARLSALADALLGLGRGRR